MRCRLAVYWILLLGIYLPSQGQYTLRHLTVDQGLTNNTVPCVYKDRDGFLWFGTYDGLNRYDGYALKTYRHIVGDSTSLGDGFVFSVVQDGVGDHWVGAASGLFILSAVTGQFSPALCPGPLTCQVNGIVYKENGDVLVATDSAGLCLFHQGSRTGRRIPLKSGVTSYKVTAITGDRTGGAWLSVDGAGIYHYDARTASLSLRYEENGNAICLCVGRGDTLWAGTNQGVVGYGTGPGGKSRMVLLPSIKVNAVSEDNRGRLWIGTDGSGLQVLDLGHHTMVPVTGLTGGKPLSSNAVYSIYPDEQGRQWIGTFRGGVDIFDPSRETFYSVSRQGGTDNFVFSFCEDRSGRIWIGTDGAGISIWDRRRNSFTTYDRGLPCKNIADLLTDRKGAIWVATYGAGVGRIDPGTGRYQRITPAGDTTCRLTWRLFQDREGVLWMGCFWAGGGLYKYDSATNKFVLVNRCGGSVFAIAEDSAGQIWAGGGAGLFCLDRAGTCRRHIQTAATVRSILAGWDGIIWAGTQGHGLARVKGDDIRYYIEQQGLSNNNVLTILEDKGGALWMSTYNGLNKFMPASGRFERFYYDDGLQNNQFNYNAAFKTVSGEFFFGGIKGFTFFRPSDSLSPSHFPPLVLTGVRVMNQPVDSVGGFVKGGSVVKPGALVLPYDKAVLSVDFAALEYAFPGRIRYAYFLEGWDRSWTEAGTQKTANYSGLREGDYVLHIRCTNAAGVWGNTVFTLPVRVLPPWYRTWWARLLAVVFLLSVAALILYYWQRQVRARYELSASEWKHRNEMELNERRLSFFTNISHELRSPLSLIINPIREMLKNEAAQPDSFNLGIVYTNAQRLLKMTDRLLLFRKVNTELGELECKETDLLNLCRQVFFCFEDEARSKAIHYTLACALEGAVAYVDPEKIEIILYNLISNAVKFCPDQGEVVVGLGEGEGAFLLTVRDTGPGIPMEARDRLFEKFVQAPSEEAPKGFGIGLYLAKALADMHCASLTFACPPEGGTIFSIRIPRQDAPALSVQHFLQDTAPGEAPPDSGLEQELVSSRKTLLVIDNDRQISAYIQHLFPDLVVHICENADEGWQKVQELGPDLIISDIFMDGTDGIAFCKKLKSSNFAHIPVILLTGRAAADVRLQGAESGADEFITKPFEAELLRARVYNMLKDRELLRKFFFNEITLQTNTLKISEEYQGFLAACISIVEEQIDRDDFDSKKFAKLMGMSRSRLYAKVKSISGLSVNEFVKLIRLRKAAELMIHTPGQIKEISFQVGFNDIKYFREQFTRLFGVKPSDYIRRYRKNFQPGAHLNDQFTQIKGK